MFAPRFEIVICTYNNAPVLDRALEAIARQKIPPGLRWSVLVVDNNCTDGTPAVVRRHVRSGRIPSLRRVVELNQGLTDARLRGARESAADWIAFVDDDCMLAEDWLAEAVRFAETQPRCGAFGGEIRLQWEVPPTPLALRYRKAYSEQDYGPEPVRLPTRRPYRYLAGAGMVVRREALEACGWLQGPLLQDRKGTRLTAGGDAEINVRLLLAGYDLWYTPACHLDHRIPERRMAERYLIDLHRGIGAGSCRMIMRVIHPSLVLKLLSCGLRIGRDLGLLAALLVASPWSSTGRSAWRIQWGHLRGFVREVWPSFLDGLPWMGAAPRGGALGSARPL